jgi:hypothetical protein
MTPKIDHDKAIECEANGSKWLADGNAAAERGNTEKAEKCFAKAQYWLDKANVYRGWN